nr:type VII secretion integral membrane protein EccD [Mycolicibacterium flavescens]
MVGSLKLDVGLPPDVSIAEYIGDVVDIANAQVALRNPADDRHFDDPDNQWTLARLGGAPIEPRRSLSEAGVYDGELLVICRAGQPLSQLLFDDVDAEGAGGGSAVWSWIRREGATLTAFGIAVAATITVAALVPRWAERPVVPASILGLGVLGIAFACLLGTRAAGPARSAWVAATVLPLVFGGALYVVPGGFGTTSLPMAFALTALGSLVVLLISRSGRALHTAVIAACTFGGVASTAMLLTQPPPRTVGAIMATAAVIAVYLAPRVTIALSKLPLPRVPTAGEPLDDIETQGGTTVEGVNAVGKQIIPTEQDLIRRVRRANEYLTGILVAAAVAAVVGSYLAADGSDGFFWQGTVFALVVATVLSLRGRRHHDLVQSAVLIGAGLTSAIAVIVKTAVLVEDWQIKSVIALLMLMLMVATFGLVAPAREFSPVARRWVEIIEYIAIGLMFPLCMWIIRLYAFFRELRI